MKEKQLYDRNLFIENEGSILLRYFLLSDASTQKGKAPNYGIKIEKLLVDGANETVVEDNKILGISTDYNLICKTIKKLHDGAVTPITLSYIIDDLKSTLVDYPQNNNEDICM